MDERLAALAYLKKNPNDGIIKQIYGAMSGNDSELREATCFTLWEIGASGYKLPHPTVWIWVDANHKRNHHHLGNAQPCS